MNALSPEVSVLPLRTPTLPPATHTNCYFLGSESLTIVEPASPWPEEQEKLLDTVSALVSAGKVMERIFLTHHHVDHIGGVQALSEALNCPVVAHPRTAELLAGQLEIHAFLEEGDCLETDCGPWDVLHTPGHATGHICLFNPRSGELVAGDMVAGEGTIVLDPPEGVLADYLDSLKRLRALGPRVLYPAHGPPLTEAQAVLSWYIEHRLERTEQVRDCLARSSASPEELVAQIYTEIPPAYYPVAARQVLCHLQWMESQNEVREESGRWHRNGGQDGG